jgi:hypothetical protein
MVATPLRLNSKSMKSLEIASSASGSSATTSMTAAASRGLPNDRRGPSQPSDDMAPAAAGPACTLLATAEAIAGGGEAHPTPRRGQTGTVYNSSTVLDRPAPKIQDLGRGREDDVACGTHELGRRIEKLLEQIVF